MRRYKPDIIVLLTFLVGIGIVATTVAQAAVPSDNTAAPARVIIRDSGPIGADGCYLCRVFKEMMTVKPSGTRQAAPDGGPVNVSGEPILGMDDQGRYRDSGIGYRLPMLTTTNDGGVDLTLRLSNHRTPTTLLDPYFSLSLSGHW